MFASCHKQKSKAVLLVPSTTASAADDVISLATPEALSAMMPSMMNRRYGGAMERHTSSDGVLRDNTGISRGGWPGVTPAGYLDQCSGWRAVATLDLEGAA